MNDDIRLVELSSGLRVVTERVPGARSVCSGAWVAVGARDEPAALSGVSHFLEHLLFKGTERRSAQELSRAVDRVGGEMNAFTTKEYTAYYTRLPAGNLGLGVDLLGDVLTAPALRDDDVESERQVILEELAMDDDTPDDRVHTLAYESLFPAHPLGRETAGARASVAEIGAEDVRAFFRRWYRPANVVVAVAGDIDHDDAVSCVEHAFGHVPAGGEAPSREAPSDEVRPLAVMRRSTEQVHLTVGYRALARLDPDREALEVANHVLGGGMSSRLFEEIREKRGLAYSVFSAPASYGDAGVLSVYAGTAVAHVDEVLDLIDVELERLAAAGIDDEELAIAVGYLTGSYAMGLEDASSRMARNGGQVTVLGYVRPVDEQLERYRAVTRLDVARVAARVLGGPRTLAAVGPVTAKALKGRAAAHPS